MLSVSNISLQYGKRILFEDVNLSFTPGNCYGIIGANGAGKSTFLKILSKEIEPTFGNVSLEPRKRISVLEQDHNAYDNQSVIDAVIMGNRPLYAMKKEMDDIYAKENFNDADGDRVGELQVAFEEIGGWTAESDAATLLSGLGVSEDLHSVQMSNLDNKAKVRVLLAQVLFGNPDVLIMDEPTNNLDFTTISWLENFLANYKNTVIVVSHDRHFLDAVCTDICDIDFSKINHYNGNYTFWYESSQLAAKQKVQQNKKAEEKAKELQDFIRRFSANVAKSKQATSRKKMLSKLKIEDIRPSSRKYPGIIFEQEREAGDQILTIKNLSSQSKDGDLLFKDVNLTLKGGDKVVVLSNDSRAISALYEIINNRIKPLQGFYEWGVTIINSYLPQDNEAFFNVPLSLVDWLRQWAKTDEEQEEPYLRGFLGKMLFSGEEALKKCNVLSGGEKVRCMLSRMMMTRGNVLVMDEPTNHLDLETITTLNNSLNLFKGTILLTTRDHQFAHTIGNRIVEIGPRGMIDKYMPFDDYLEDKSLKSQREQLYQ